MIAPIDIPYAYTYLCDRLRRALDIKESAQFLIGDILNETETVYAERTIAGLAADIGVSPSSLYNYRDMVARYPPSVRELYRGKGLYFSHLRLALAYDTLDESCAFLDEVYANGWSVTRAAIELKRLKGGTVAPMPQYATCTFHREGNRVYINGADLEGIVMDEGVRYELVIRVKR